MKTPSLRRIAKAALRLVLIVAASLALAEIYVRFLFPVPMLPRYVQATDLGIRGNVPSLTYVHRTPDYRVEIRTNAQGIRADREIPYEKPAGTKRVVLLGDSFAMGYGVDLADTFIERMRSNLAARGIDVEIVNLAVSGFGNSECLVKLEKEGLRYDPDLVIATWHRSDLEDNVRSKLFVLEGDQLIPAASTYLPGVKTQAWLSGFWIYRWVSENCHLYYFLRELAAARMKDITLTLRGKASRGEEEGDRNREEEEPDESSADSDDGPKPRELLAAAILERMHRVTKDHGAEFLILSIPRRMEREYIVSTFLDHGEKERYGWHVVEPLPYLYRRKGEVLYWESSHGHFTPLGCRLVGEALSDYILEHDLLGAAPR